MLKSSFKAVVASAAFVTLAVVAAGDVFAQRVGEIVQVGGQNWSVLTLSGETMVLQRVGGAAPQSQAPQMGTQTTTLDGVWSGVGGAVSQANITIVGTGGTLTKYGYNGNGYHSSNVFIRTGNPIIRDIYSTGRETWSCEFYAYITAKSNRIDDQNAGLSWQQANISSNGTDMVISSSGSGTWKYTFNKSK